MPSPPTTNPTPTEVLEAFRELGVAPIHPWEISSIHIRVLTSRGLHLAANISTPEEQDEFNAIEQELANRVMGRAPYLK